MVCKTAIPDALVNIFEVVLEGRNCRVNLA
jgi:hypothetical protein